MPLDAAELADLQADMTADLLTDTAQVLRKTATDNGGGRQSTAWANGKSYPCRMWSKPSYRDMTEGVQAGSGRLAATVVWFVLLPAGADVLAADRLVVNGQTLEVTERDAGRTDAVTVQVFCKRVG